MHVKCVVSCTRILLNEFSFLLQECLFFCSSEEHLSLHIPLSLVFCAFSFHSGIPSSSSLVQQSPYNTRKPGLFLYSDS